MEQVRDPLNSHGDNEPSQQIENSVAIETNDPLLESDFLYTRSLENCDSSNDLNTSHVVQFHPEAGEISSEYPAPSVESFSDLLSQPLPTPQSVHRQGGRQGVTDPIDATFDPSDLFWMSQSDSNVITGKISLEPYTEPRGSTQTSSYAASRHPGLPRRRSRYLIRKVEGRATPVYIPNAGKLDPMQRWQESPPEDEPASMTAIQNAIEETSAHRGTSRRNHARKPTNAFDRYRRPASTTSGESSASSTDSAWSASSCSSRVKKRRSRAGGTKTNATDSKPRIFCCTFCCDRFGTRYEWVRHEKSLHLNLESWYCTPLGPSIFSTVTGREHCAFCNTVDPSLEHLSEHNYETCHNLSKELRSFRRKDHLVQHLRHVHGVNGSPFLDDWEIETKNISSRCGFCDTPLQTWDERVDHLARHFRRGYTMKDWKGDHDFPPFIAAQLKNAYPPYLLGWESGSIIPFSATDKDVHDHYAQAIFRTNGSDGIENKGPGSTEPQHADYEEKSQFEDFMHGFTRHLSQFARSHMERGVMPTDEMFQRESRRVLFDSEDAWNQTIADSPDWLSAFRRLHCGAVGDTAGALKQDHRHEISNQPGSN